MVWMIEKLWRQYEVPVILKPCFPYIKILMDYHNEWTRIDMLLLTYVKISLVLAGHGDASL